VCFILIACRDLTLFSPFYSLYGKKIFRRVVLFSQWMSMGSKTTLDPIGIHSMNKKNIKKRKSGRFGMIQG